MRHAPVSIEVESRLARATAMQRQAEPGDCVPESVASNRRGSQRQRGGDPLKLVWGERDGWSDDQTRATAP